LVGCGGSVVNSHRSGNLQGEIAMSSFDSYARKYSCIHMRRENGILEMRFHTDNGPLRWGLGPHGELPDAFADVARDRDNRVVILTGTGDEWSGVRATPGQSAISAGLTAAAFDRVHWEGRALLMNLLSIEVPVISAINGPAWRHGEIPLLSDIVLASETAAFQDSAHFPNGLVPWDGMHIVMPMLLGINRGRYFLLTGQTLSAQEAKDLGLVAEVLPRDKVLARAWEHAEVLARKPTLLLRYTRLMFTEYLKKRMQDLLGYGLAMEGLALMEQADQPK
jgi:enoyl-CoA hydratase/carnithine racemase